MSDDDDALVIASAPENAVASLQTADTGCCEHGATDALRLQPSASSSAVLSTLSGTSTPPLEHATSDSSSLAPMGFSERRPICATRTSAAAAVNGAPGDDGLPERCGTLGSQHWSALQSAVVATEGARSLVPVAFEAQPVSPGAAVAAAAAAACARASSPACVPEAVAVMTAAEAAAAASSPHGTQSRSRLWGGTFVDDAAVTAATAAAATATTHAGAQSPAVVSRAGSAAAAASARATLAAVSHGRDSDGNCNSCHEHPSSDRQESLGGSATSIASLWAAIQAGGRGGSTVSTPASGDAAAPQYSVDPQQHAQQQQQLLVFDDAFPVRNNTADDNNIITYDTAFGCAPPRLPAPAAPAPVVPPTAALLGLYPPQHGDQQLQQQAPARLPVAQRAPALQEPHGMLPLRHTVHAGGSCSPLRGGADCGGAAGSPRAGTRSSTCSPRSALLHRTHPSLTGYFSSDTTGYGPAMAADGGSFAGPSPAAALLSAGTTASALPAAAAAPSSSQDSRRRLAESIAATAALAPHYCTGGGSSRTLATAHDGQSSSTAAAAAAAQSRTSSAAASSANSGGGGHGGAPGHGGVFGFSFSRPPTALAMCDSYTTYGYRRAHSSLAALEASRAGGVATGPGCSGGGLSVDDSDSDDDTEEATRRITAAFRTHTGMARSSGWGLLGTDSAPTTPSGNDAVMRRDPWGNSSHALNAAAGGGGAGGAGGAQGGAGGGGVQGSGEHSTLDGNGSDGGGKDGADDDDSASALRKRGSYHLTNSHAAVELFLRLNHARQTMDFVKRQTQLFGALDKASMSVWDALSTLDELREYEAVLMADASEAQEVSELSLLDHAFQTAELCRLHHPDTDWLHLAGLLHGLGKLLAHRTLGSQPQWAICGETYPLGCRFSPHILGAQYFTANPDRRRRLYNTQTGVYGPGCGLLHVVMSWSAPEYLYLVLLMNGTRLPQDALWLLRHAKFASLARPHSCYLPLCNADDLRRMPLLRSFQSLSAYRRTTDLPEGFALQGEARTAYYKGLIEKYIGLGKLRW